MISSATRDRGLSRGRRMLLAVGFCALLLWLGGPLLRLIVTTSLLLSAPGFLLERLLPGPRLHPLLRSALWIGLSLSAIVLLYAGAWVLGLALSTPILNVLAAMLGIGAGVVAWLDLRSERDRQPLSLNPIWVAFGVICLLTFGLRFVQIEGLALPPWVDSVHHALLVRVAAEQGGVPLDLRPYMPIEELTYHWGFHVVAAAFMQLSSADLGDTLLWSGQLLNALHGPLVGALAFQFHRRPAAALGAALSVGILSYFPAYYLSWGRYTQLMGLLLAPALAIVWQTALERRHPHWWAAAAVLIAGLGLIHVRVLLFVLSLLAAQSLLWALRSEPAQLRQAIIGAVAAGAGAALLCAPWLLVLARQIVPAAVAQPQNFVAESSYAAISTSLLWAGDGRWLTTLGLLAAAWGIRQRRSSSALVAIWIGLLLLLAQPALLAYVLPALGAVLLVQGLNTRRVLFLIGGGGLLFLNPLTLDLPATWLISGDSVVISLFLPIGVALGGGLADLSASLRRQGPQIARWSLPLIAVSAIAVGIWGAERRQQIVNPGTIIATAADLEAITWVRANTAADARFLINTAPWLGIANRGVDGGWWLLPLAGRWTSTPPVIFTYGPADYVAEVIATGNVVTSFRPGGEQAIRDLIAREGIDYLYLTDRSGALRAEQFAGLPGFRTVYAQDGVTILAVESQS